MALKKLRSTLKFRRSIGIEEIITAFDNGVDGDGDCSDMADKLEKGLSSKKFYVQGYDKEGRSTLYFIPRNVHGHDAEMTLKDAIYSIERAVACSKANDGTINAIVDFSKFSILRHSPPFDIGKKFMTSLRNHYAGQIHRIYIVNAPTTFSILWRMFQPFIGTTTREKIYMLSGNKVIKEMTMNDMYNVSQLPNWIISNGKKNRSLDINEYLYNTKFDQSFDDE